MANAYNAGQARASGYIGSANALSNALNQVGNIAQQVPMQGYFARGAAGPSDFGGPISLPAMMGRKA